MKRLAILICLCTLAATSVACSSNRTTGQRLDDSVITTKVEARLAADPEVSAFAVDVDTENGVVRLSGVVEEAAARQEAESLARNTDGVVRVVNDITVGKMTAGERFNDSATTVKVKAKLTADPEVNPFDVDVDTDRGVVTLSGTVGSDRAKSEAENLAESVEGVVEVRNLLKVAAE